ncbi:enhanced intracellular survival protein Eis [Streptomyces sp. NPDC056056]|uniref:GNAT family N-acetyltransferase n=1 Tax=Streptomyces sp. NPDC056056 TaxID=3345698 RepID=UPI0035D981DB
MPEDTSVEVVEADDRLWREYDLLARRSYGQPVGDISRLREHADIRVALRDSQVIGGGLGLLVPQYFGGKPVPSACLAGGCIAPEERGAHLWSLLLDERIRPLQDQGAVLATAWTASTGYGRRMGWAAPAPVFSWEVPSDQLGRSFADIGFKVTHLPEGHTGLRQAEFAAKWNGPWLRPQWWSLWQQDVHPDLTHYEFSLPGRAPAGLLTLGFDRHPVDGRRLVVHDFWADSADAASAMLCFLGRHSSRIPTIMFQRTALPPAPLLQRLHRAGAAAATSWHPWMLRVLDPSKAVELRGWPGELDMALSLTVTGRDGDQTFDLRIGDGCGELAPTSRLRSQLALTEQQFAVWYAGGYRSATSALLDGVGGAPAEVARLVGATSETEPWLPEYF